MLGHAPYYHQHIRRYVSLFGTLFNDLAIIRKDKNGNEKLIKIPLSYARKDKALMRLQQDPDLLNTWSTALPRMAFHMNTPAYNPERKQNSVNFTRRNENGNVASMQYSPAPYDIDFELSIWTQYFEDGLQIVEQILPFFQPEYVVSAKEIPELGIDRDIHIVLNSVVMDDSAEGSFEDNRIIEWVLGFTVQGFFYGPVETKGVIKTTQNDTFFTPDFEGAFVRQTATIDPFEAAEHEPHEIIETTTTLNGT